jgi:hypothetical protein
VKRKTSYFHIPLNLPTYLAEADPVRSFQDYSNLPTNNLVLLKYFYSTFTSANFNFSPKALNLYIYSQMFKSYYRLAEVKCAIKKEDPLNANSLTIS